MPVRLGAVPYGFQERELDRTGSFAEMQGRIGQLIRLWGKIERVAEEIDASHPGEEPRKRLCSVSSRLDRWMRRVQADAEAMPFRAQLAVRLRQQLRDAQKVRNGICHGLIGILAATVEQPGRIFWRNRTKEHCRTWSEMQAHFAWLSKVPVALLILQRGDMSCHGRLHRSVANLEWWTAEYGVDLT
jgi:hypothetical protein